jgi:ATP-dependent DNA helicase RecG
MSNGADVLKTPLRVLRGVGPRRASDLRRAGLSTIEDLLYRFPIRYEDRSRLQAIAELLAGNVALVAGEVVTCGVRLTRRPGFRIFEALLRDESGSIHVLWFNQPFLRDVIRTGQRMYLYGPVEDRLPGGRQLVNPQYEILEEELKGEGLHAGRIVPVYERAGTVTSKMQRRLVMEALDLLPGDMDDPLPAELRQELRLPDRRTALAAAHFPDLDTPVDLVNRFRAPAQVRLIFEELFLLQAGLVLRRRGAEHETKPFQVKVDGRVRDAARAVLPFKLTAGQRAAIRRIVADMAAPGPMHRLLQGDVGSGKTIVALLAAVVAMENQLQVAFMAPTEILAEQQYLTLRRLLEGSSFRVELLTGSTRAASRRKVLAGLSGADIHLVVGTHALLQEGVDVKRLGLVVIDEQHRFGVLQRAMLRSKGLNPDVLVMTATPIPRTLALTAYGDLDVTVIKDMPPGRQPVATTVRPESRRSEVYELVREQLEAGRQAYVVYPLVEESSKIDLKAATEMADHLAQEEFQPYSVALLHGRMPQDTKDNVMRAFARGEVDVLVCTTVVEVGVDVPNATVMVVEHSERFGLSQLHQLRGRVGRGEHRSYCVLLYQSPLSETARSRLQILAETNDGFLIAEQDMELRGPGDLAGVRQAGVPALRVGDLRRDRELLEEARAQAESWMGRGVAAAPVVEFVRSVWDERFGLMSVG